MSTAPTVDRLASPDLLTPILDPFSLPVRFTPGWLVVCPDLAAAAQCYGFCVSALIHRHAALDHVQTPRRYRDSAAASLARTARHLDVVSCFYTAAGLVSLHTRYEQLYAFNQTIAVLGRPTP